LDYKKRGNCGREKSKIFRIIKKLNTKKQKKKLKEEKKVSIKEIKNNIEKNEKWKILLFK